MMKEMNVYSWQHLKIGDAIELTGSDNGSAWKKYKGKEMIVERIDLDGYISTKSPSGRTFGASKATRWRFIRRP